VTYYSPTFLSRADRVITCAETRSDILRFLTIYTEMHAWRLIKQAMPIISSFALPIFLVSRHRPHHRSHEGAIIEEGCNK